MKVYKFSPKLYFGSNTYLVISGGEAVVIDPSVSFSEVKATLGEAKVKYLLLTHCHFDHILMLEEWVERTGAEVIVGLLDKPGLSDPVTNCCERFLDVDCSYYGSAVGVTERDTLHFGEETVRIIATPGHTAGRVSYLIGDALCVVDNVLPSVGFGGCEFPGGNEIVLFASISHLCELEGEITVYSGHGVNTSLSEIKRYFK